MAVETEINLFRPSDEAFTPGNTVSGFIRYRITEEMEFNKITISLKGLGTFIARNKYGRKKHTVRKSETYVDVDSIIHETENNEQKSAFTIGLHEIPFGFELPHNIPASLNFNKKAEKYVIDCKIIYYVRIKFEKPSFLSFAKRFQKQINVVTGIIPRLSINPSVYRETKSLTQLFTFSNSIVFIDATIQSCVIKPGGTIQLSYEVANGTNLSIKSIETKLLETYKLICSESFHFVIKDFEEVPNTNTKTGKLRKRESRNMSVEIIVPQNLFSSENSQIFSREYVVAIKVELPCPHRDAVMKIPVQIGDIDLTDGRNIATGEEPPPPFFDTSPPSYFEAMKEDDDSDYHDE